MKYIIDANNLAGKLKIIGEDNFDRKLIRMIEEYIRNRNNEYVLVFDPRDEWGDKKMVNEKLLVIYSPKDRYYESADDKIVEMISNMGTGSDLEEKEQITVVTDDIGLNKRVQKTNENRRNEVLILRSTEFAAKIIKKKTDKKNEEPEDELESGQKNLINDELLDIWK